MYHFLFCFFFSVSVFGQKPLLQEQPILSVKEILVGADAFGHIYTLQKHIFRKKGNGQQWQFADYGLGIPDAISVVNPLKIMLFYEAVGTVIFLDRFLVEVQRIDLLQNPQNYIVTHAAMANTTNLWLYDNASSQVVLYDYQDMQAVQRSLPINESVIELKGNFTSCWVLTDAYVYQLNRYGVQVATYPNDSYTVLHPGTRNNAIVYSEKGWFSLKNGTVVRQDVPLPENTNMYSTVAGEILYIYDQNGLQTHTLLTSKNDK